MRPLPLCLRRPICLRDLQLASLLEVLHQPPCLAEQFDSAPLATKHGGLRVQFDQRNISQIPEANRNEGSRAAAAAYRKTVERGNTRQYLPLGERDAAAGDLSSKTTHHSTGSASTATRHGGLRVQSDQRNNPQIPEASRAREAERQRWPTERLSDGGTLAGTICLARGTPPQET